MSLRAVLGGRPQGSWPAVQASRSTIDTGKAMSPHKRLRGLREMRLRAPDLRTDRVSKAGSQVLVPAPSGADRSDALLPKA
jgi:hypothetical protein